LEDSAGYGLGLSIVKSIADYHKIAISISSEIAKGTTITLSFPAELIRT
jgi:signal transduction histidine kinase